MHTEKRTKATTIKASIPEQKYRTGPHPKNQAREKEVDQKVYCPFIPTIQEANELTRPTTKTTDYAQAATPTACLADATCPWPVIVALRCFIHGVAFSSTGSSSEGGGEGYDSTGDKTSLCRDTFVSTTLCKLGGAAIWI